MKCVFYALGDLDVTYSTDKSTKYGTFEIHRNDRLRLTIH